MRLSVAVGFSPAEAPLTKRHEQIAKQLRPISQVRLPEGSAELGAFHVWFGHFIVFKFMRTLGLMKDMIYACLIAVLHLKSEILL